MTVDQVIAKLNLLPLTEEVEVSYDFEDPENPLILCEFAPSNEIRIPLNPNNTNLADMANNLPLANSDRLASLAILLAPALPGNE